MVFVETMPAESVIFRLDEAERPLKTMYYYVEALPTDTENIVTRGGVRYKLYNTVKARYNGVTEEDFVALDGFTKVAAAETVNGAALTPRSFSGLKGQYYIASTTQDQSIYFFYSRDSYKINYMDGAYFDGNGNLLNEPGHGQWDTSEDIYYQADISSYNKDGENYYAPTASGYSFGGWYIDDSCTQPYTFDKMPKGGVTVYAKWIKNQYRVFLHPNVPTTDTSYDLGDQSTSFRVNYGDKIAGGNSIPATRADYELIGWYMDEACTIPFNFDAYVLNDTTVTTPYLKTEDTERDKYGNPTASGNSDTTRFWIDKKLDLYAKWRSKIEGAPGINVQYDAVDGKGSFSDGKTTHLDPLTYYLDRAEATAQAASTATDPEKQFIYWVVQRWDESQGKYVDTDEHVYPGDIFEVQKAYAHEETIPEPTDPNITKTYTVQLRAEYGDRDTPTPTHITWYANNGTGDSVTDSDLQINEAVDIKPATTFTRDGYRFLGWARMTEVNENGAVTTIGGVSPENLQLDTLGEDDLFLKYDYETGKFIATENTGVEAGKTISKIAADEKLDYHGMVAVWKRAYTVTVKKLSAAWKETDRSHLISVKRRT